MTKPFSIIGGLVVIGTLVFLVLSSGKQSQNMDMMAGMTLPDFALRNYEGQVITRASFAGKPLVINSWAAWCPFCVKEMPDFAKLQEGFGDTIVVILIDRAESLETAKKFSDEVGVTDRLILLLDPTDSFYQSIGGFSMPETIFVNVQGTIIDHKRGPMEFDEMQTRAKNSFQL